VTFLLKNDFPRLDGEQEGLFPEVLGVYGLSSHFLLSLSLSRLSFLFLIVSSSSLPFFALGLVFSVCVEGSEHPCDR